jgi:hypothetical protein
MKRKKLSRQGLVFFWFGDYAIYYLWTVETPGNTVESNTWKVSIQEYRGILKVKSQYFEIIRKKIQKLSLPKLAASKGHVT